jgi:hypothetical protein
MIMPVMPATNISATFSIGVLFLSPIKYPVSTPNKVVPSAPIVLRIPSGS